MGRDRLFLTIFKRFGPTAENLRKILGAGQSLHFLPKVSEKFNKVLEIRPEILEIDENERLVDLNPYKTGFPTTLVVRYVF